MNKDGLIFEWPGRHHLHLLLPVAVLGAILVHLALFFLFSISYPRPDQGAVNSPEVFVVLPGSAGFARLAALLDSEDPSVFAPARGLPAAESLRADYTPQYALAKAALEPLPEPTSSPVRRRPAFGPVSLRLGEPPERPTPGSPPSMRLAASGVLATRIPSLPSEPSLWPASGTNPGPVEFLAVVRPDGSIAHLFPQQSSGSEEFDRRALDAVRQLKFAPGSSNPAWGILTLEWGTP